MDINLQAHTGDEKRRIVVDKEIRKIFEQSMDFKHVGIPNTYKKYLLINIQQQYIENNEKLYIFNTCLRILKIDSIQAVIPKMEKFTKVFFSHLNFFT